MSAEIASHVTAVFVSSPTVYLASTSVGNVGAIPSRVSTATVSAGAETADLLYATVITFSLAVADADVIVSLLFFLSCTYAIPSFVTIFSSSATSANTAQVWAFK